MIHDRHTYFPDQTEEEKRRRTQRMLVANGLPVVQDWQPRGAQVIAFINHGRWIAYCPTRCNNAEFVGAEFPFVCTECGFGPARAMFPANRQAIETALLKRTKRETRNWSPGESPEDLELENKEHTDALAKGAR